ALGLFRLIGMVSCAIERQGAMKFLYRFRDVASIWTERNLLLKDSYWPRQAYLEVIRFKGSKNDPKEMRIPDGSSPELWVRSARWVVADATAPEGWRPMRWNELEKYLGHKVTVPLPKDWDGWVVDLDDLNPEEPAFQLLPERWRNQTIRYVKQDLENAGGNVAELMGRLSRLPGPGFALAGVLSHPSLFPATVDVKKSL